MDSPLTLTDIGPEYQSQVSTQQYTPYPRIDGVQIHDLRLLQDDGGSFAELVRINESGCLEAYPSFQVRQTSFALMQPRAIKAFHLHFGQEDLWFVPPTDRLLIGLLDLRQASPTYQAQMRFIFGSGKAQLLYIPRGVAHGAVNLGVQPATVLYFVNQQFQLADPDERRLPWDILGREFWEYAPG